MIEQDAVSYTGTMLADQIARVERVIKAQPLQRMLERAELILGKCWGETEWAPWSEPCPESARSRNLCRQPSGSLAVREMLHKSTR